MARSADSGADWVALKQEFITSDISLKDIAAKAGVGPAYVRRRAAAEDWSDQRAQWRADVLKKATAITSENRAQQLKDWNRVDIQASQAIRTRVLKKIKAIQESVNAHERTSELRELMGVLESTQRVTRLAMGATTDNQGFIGDPGEDGVGTPRLKDFYQTVQFEGPTQPAPTGESDVSKPSAAPAPVTKH